MSVICLASLKGGVGKTSLAVNISHAFAKRGCRTLLIDLDPSAHATRLLALERGGNSIAKLLFNKSLLESVDDEELFLDCCSEIADNAVIPVRDQLDLLAGGAELKHCFWGRGARAFRRIFPTLLRELSGIYDHIVVDTAPDFNVVTRNALAVSHLAVVPVDSSEMSICSLEEIIHSARHLEQPSWCIVRSMVNRSAKRIQRLGTQRLSKQLDLADQADFSQTLSEEERFFAQADGDDVDEFISSLRDRETPEEIPRDGAGEQKPIFLLRSMTYRTEQQNRLTYGAKTSFDLRSTEFLAQQYSAVARELENLCTLLGRSGESEEDIDSFIGSWVASDSEQGRRSQSAS